MTELLRSVIAEIEKLPVEQQNAIRLKPLPAGIASRLLAELKQEPENILLEQLVSTEAVVWSPYEAYEAAQTLSELLAAAKQKDNA